MKIVQINCNGYFGSTGKLVRKISDHLFEKGVENYIVCSGYGEQKHDDNTFFVSDKVTVKINQATSYLLGDAGFHFKRTTRKVIRLIEKLKPDAVHLHHLESFFINVPYLIRYLKKKKIPTVWTMHDCWPITGHCTHFFSVNCDKWTSGCHHCPQKKQFPYSLLFDRSKRNYSLKKRSVEGFDDLHVANVSDWMQSLIKRSFLKEKEMRVIYNGINVNVFCPAPANEELKRSIGAEGKFIILSVASRWSEKKGLDYFTELSARLKDDEIIVLVGMEEEQISKLPERIIGIGKIRSQKELCEYYRLADVYLNLSEEETFGLVSVEAMACGTPVVACPTTANPEIVGDCGIILKTRRIDEIEKAVDEVRKNGKAFYSGKCVKRVKDNFSDETMCEGYYKYYLDVIKK